MTNHPLNTKIILIRCCLLAGKHVLGIKYIQSLILHGSHVEIIHRHNHKHIKIVLKTEFFLIPLHTLFERSHGMTAFVLVAGLNIYFQINCTAGSCNKGIFKRNKISGNKCKQVTWFGKGVFPYSKMTPFGKFSFLNKVSVRKQNRTVFFIRFDTCTKPCHHIRSVKIIGYLSKTLSFTLGTKISA